MEEGSRRMDASQDGVEEDRDIDRDAMGNDKRRLVVGGQYGATLRKRLLVYGAAVGTMVVLVVVFFTVVKNVDEREMPLKNTAPWAQADENLSQPRDVDFQRNGPFESDTPASEPRSGDTTIPPGEIFTR